MAGVQRDENLKSFPPPGIPPAPDMLPMRAPNLVMPSERVRHPAHHRSHIGERARLRYNTPQTITAFPTT